MNLEEVDRHPNGRLLNLPSSIMEPSIYQWVNDHNPPDDTQWGPGFWDYVEFLFHVKEVLDFNVTVPGSYVWKTPPPEEALELPVFRAVASGFELIGKHCMAIRPDFLVSVRCQPLEHDLGLMTEFRPSRLYSSDGFPEGWLFPPFKSGCRAFTGLVGDEYDLYALIRLLGGASKKPA